MIAPGATPKETTSASESSCFPISESAFKSLATNPSKKSTTAAGEAVTTIRQSYAALIQQTINLTVTGSQEVTIWHDVPNTPNDYGEPGWMAYDGDYHYIYAGGRWLRQSIADWIA